MVFVDTGGWFAAFVPTDSDHDVASRWFDANRVRLVTTDYVIDELMTLLRARGQDQIAVEFGTLLFSGDLCRIERVQPADFDRTWAIFSTYLDKEWSFTDCVSRVVMARLGISVAFAFDEHFRQFGTVAVVP